MKLIKLLTIALFTMLANSVIKFASMADLVYSQFKAEGMENIDWMLYDSAFTAVSSTQTLKFFQNSSSAGKSRTNMTVAGQLPDPQAFLCTGVDCLIYNVDGAPMYTGGNTAPGIYPVNALLSKAYMKINVSPKDMFETHMREFYSPVDVAAVSSATPTSVAGTINGMLFRKGYKFQIPIMILPQRHFELEMTLTTPADGLGYTAANTLIMWVMKGLLRRNSN
jgi:hypothetical protein